MKRFFYAAVATPVALALMLSCSGEEPIPGNSDVVKGHYLGTITYGTMGRTNEPIDPAVVIVKRTAPDEVSVTVPASTYNAHDIPSFKFTDVPVSEGEVYYTLGRTELTHGDYQCAVSGTVNGDVASINYTVQHVEMSTPITYIFKGQK